MGVLELEISTKFYCDVFECTVALQESDAALSLAPDGFQIYLYANRSSAQRPIGAGGVKFLDGRDLDGNRILVAYPSPLQLPRHIIADRFK